MERDQVKWICAGVGTVFVLLAVFFGVNVTSTYGHPHLNVGVGLVACGFAVGGGLCLLAAAVAHRVEAQNVTQSQAERIAAQAERIDQLERELRARSVGFSGPGSPEDPG